MMLFVNIVLIINAVFWILVLANKISTKHFEKKYNIYEPQRYKVIFGGVGLDTLILYAPTRKIAEKISIKYLFGFDECYIEDLETTN